MAEHRTLTGVQLHEPKGADTAAAGTVYISDGAGSGTWSTITPSQAPDVMALAQGSQSGSGNPYDDDLTLAQTYDSNGLYNPTTGIFTAAEAGTYLVDCTYSITPTGNNDVNFELQKNGIQEDLISQDSTETGVRYLNVVVLGIGDNLRLNCNGSNNSGFTITAAIIYKKVV